MRPAFVVHHARTGIVALNVVSAALPDDVEVVFARDREEMVRALETRRAIAGWSFYSTDFAQTVDDFRWVRERAPAVFHLAGGVHATAEPLQTLQAGFDYVALGEGEATIRRIFDGSFDEGVASLSPDGKLVSRGAGARRPLDAFPGFNARYGKWNALEITRGCVYACSFCQTPYMFKARFRHRSVENVREHVRWVRRDGGKYMRFLSPTCLSYGSADTSVNLGAVDALLGAVREELGADGRIYFGTFPSECRPEHVTPAALRVLKKWVDNDALVIGGQSGSDAVLERTHRGHSVAEVEQAVRYALEAGIGANVDFLLGLPGESPEERQQSIAFAQKLVSLGARIHSHAFMPLPGTPLGWWNPEPIEPEVVRAMENLESAGAMYGQWRRQLEAANQLVALRTSKSSSSIRTR